MNDFETDRTGPLVRPIVACESGDPNPYLRFRSKKKSIPLLPLSLFLISSSLSRVGGAVQAPRSSWSFPPPPVQYMPVAIPAPSATACRRSPEQRRYLLCSLCHVREGLLNRAAPSKSRIGHEARLSLRLSAYRSGRLGVPWRQRGWDGGNHARRRGCALGTAITTLFY